MPIGLKLTERGIISWLKSRVVHKKRVNAEILLTKLGLSFNDILGIIRASQGLSLNDSYWVVEDGFDGKFENYNLYENKFSRTLALIALYWTRKQCRKRIHVFTGVHYERNAK